MTRRGHCLAGPHQRAPSPARGPPETPPATVRWRCVEPSRRADERVRHDDLRRDVGARGGDRRDQPRPGLPRHRRPGRGEARPRSTRSAPATTSTRRASGSRSCGPRSPRTSSASTASSSTPTPRSSSPPGATEAIAAALLALCEPGRRGRHVRAVLRLVRGRASRWRARRGASSRCGRPTTRSIPTSCAAAITPAHEAAPAQLAAQPDRQGVRPRRSSTSIAALCREHDLLVVTDEVYEHLVFDGRSTSRSRRCPACATARSRSRRRGKTFSFTGWKIGWVCAARADSSRRCRRRSSSSPT